jgi:hypothetical protein
MFDSKGRLNVAGGTRAKAGRKRIRIDVGEVEKLCTLHCTDEEIAGFLGVSLRTFARRKQQPAFVEAMERGKAKGRLSLRRSLWNLAMKGNPAANIFLSKNLLGYRDVLSNEHSGPNGGPIAIDNEPDYSRFTEEELDQLEALHKKAHGEDGN